MAEESSSSSSDNPSVEVSFNAGVLSIVEQSIEFIPEDLAERYPDTIELHLSHNRIVLVTNIQKFTKLKNLVLDNNSIVSNQRFPTMPSVQTLCANNNQIENLATFISCVGKAFPNLSYLSMLKNKACPNVLNGREQEEYQRYRYYVINNLPHLKFLDSSPVSEAERVEAKLNGTSVILRPDQQQNGEVNHSEPALGTPLPEDGVRQPGKVRAYYGQMRYVYSGKQSEGNRFILNSDL